mmetsp:Transcript_59556/g.141712  ORF Transcript_59556/g.141712 Transcript_59556/m.141712 type:complete len:328 (-) Transcript_59556:164-1147(-)
MRKGSLLPFIGMTTLLATLAEGAKPEVAWNFAYGSNMSPQTRARRGLQPHGIVPARVDDWELRFSLRGAPFVEPAFAALHPAPAGSGVTSHGVMLALDREGWLRLLGSEGVLSPAKVAELRAADASLADVLALGREAATKGSGYCLHEVRAMPYGDSSPCEGAELGFALADAASVQDMSGSGGETITTTDLKKNAAQPWPPSERYWRLLRDGARYHNLDGRYRSFLSSLPRFRPSLLGIGALALTLPWWLSSAAQSRTTDSAGRRRARRNNTSWPELSPAVSAARGQLIIGPEVKSQTWSKFCSTSREEYLHAIRAQLGETPVLEYS